MRLTLMTALAKDVVTAHVSMVLRRRFVNARLGRWELAVTKVSADMPHDTDYP